MSIDVLAGIERVYTSLIDRACEESGRPGKWLSRILLDLNISALERPTIDSLAHIFAYIYKDELRHVINDGVGRFVWWDGEKWTMGEQKKVAEGVYVRFSALGKFFREVARKGCGPDSEGEFNPETSSGQWKWLNRAIDRVGSPKDIKEIISLVSLQGLLNSYEYSPKEHELVVRVKEGGYGVLDLYEGEVRACRKDEMVLTSTRFTLPLGRVGAYVDEGRVRGSKFYDSLSYLMGKDERDMEFMVRLLGYVCSGSVSGQWFFWIEGETRNGKSVVTDPFLELLGIEDGGLAIGLNSNTFTARSNSANDFALARVEGKRFIKVSEPPGKEGVGFMLDEELIKKLTGDGAMMVKGFYQAPKMIRVTGKVVFVCNHAPKVKDSSGAVNSRMIRVRTAGKTIEAGDREEGRVDHIVEFEQDVLAWVMCKGYREYRLKGLGVPEKYRGWNGDNMVGALCNNDTVEFVEDCLGFVPREDRGQGEKGSGRSYPTPGDVYRLYEAWVSETKVKKSHYSSTTLIDDVMRLLPGVEKRRVNGTRLVGLVMRKRVSNRGVWMEELRVEDNKGVGSEISEGKDEKEADLCK